MGRKTPGRVWQILAIVFMLVSVGLLIGLIVVATDDDDDDDDDDGDTYNAPLTYTCGEGSNPNDYVIDLQEPTSPGPFHDLTKHELKQLREYLEKDPDIRAARPGDANLTSSYMYMADLMVPSKQDVLKFLDHDDQQPARKARVIMFRGDLDPPVVQEYVCGPLPDVTSCTLLNMTSRRNPVQFSLRPFNGMEFNMIYEVLLKEVDRKIGYILEESFQANFTACETFNLCLGFSPSPIGTGILGDIKQRRMWLYGQYFVDKSFLHPLDFGVLAQLDLPDPSTWSVAGVWYNSRMFNSMEYFIDAYDNGRVNKLTVTPPSGDELTFSTLKQRGPPQPPRSQRPPTLVEPDGKRYSVKGRKVEYMGWSFNFRLSSMNGPFLYDVRFQGERIAYEMGLSEISVFYSGYAPFAQTMNYVDSGALLGTHSQSLIPGGDCPEIATFINQTFHSQGQSEPETYKNAMCLFENNNGYPLRRHSAYEQGAGAFYGGMLDSVLTLRTALTIGNYDYIVDFILHQNGVIETRFMSTGYIMSTYFTDKNSKYGFQIHKNVLGNVHHHIAHFKVDLDVGGTSNRYERVNIHNEEVTLTQFPIKKYFQNAFSRHLVRTELEALYKYSFDVPRYHVVHNHNNRTDLGAMKAYRIQMNGNSNWLHRADRGNEATVSWARHQLAVTTQKDEEFVGTSNYGFFDGLDPVVRFDSFYNDNETIVDQDLVFWITMGMHHIPHTEDLPVTPTVGNHLSFFLLPYNYFEECPSMGSRDAIFVEHTHVQEPKQGVTLTRYVDSSQQCTTPDIHLDMQLEENPDIVLKTLK